LKDLRWASIPEMVDAAALRFGAAEAVVDADRRVSFAELRVDVRRVTAALLASGIQPGDRIAIWAPNRYEWVMAALGILGAGAVLVPVYTRFKRAELTHLLRRSGARLVFSTARDDDNHHRHDGRPRLARRPSCASPTRRASSSPPGAPARCWCADTAACTATSRIRKRPRARSTPTAGCTPATWA
jgi:acyl-CoA synthetase (AMP-forming)/AMP-acid ligase II